MAVWVRFREECPLPEVASRCRAKNLYLSDGGAYNPPGKHLNACRMGFASLTEKEMQQACALLKEVLVAMEKQ
jgi:GntR family transcriptional regulator/MocR family aminotransferase